MLEKTNIKENSSGEVKQFAEAVIKNVEKVIVGKHLVIERLLIALLCEGHVLIEDAPGLARRCWRVP